ncbi:MAG TPA: trypsin-like peptidase domain-containing protein, partial [Abditibacteriaceae bacterium]|nr:trypsin-like peptidase domain-containing protein [Abditibacteriaceae bacterium]
CALVGLGATLGRRGAVGSSTGTGATGGTSGMATVDLTSQNAIVSAAQAVGPAVMNVDTTFGGGDSKEFLPDPSMMGRPRQGKGTGVVIDSKRGLMLTNAHVVADAQKIQVTTREGKKYTGKILGVDRQSDIAVVKLSSNTLPEAKLAPLKNARDFQIGQWAIAIGNPFAQANTVTVGVVSAVGRTIPVPDDKQGGNFQLTDMIQTDAAINPGNSGGPLCNIKGEVIGINTAIYGIGTGLGFSIPINKAFAVAEQIIKHGSVQRAYVGLQLQAISSATQQEYGLKDTQGALVQNAVAGSPAAKAGFQAGDIIRRINGETMKNMAQAQATIQKQKVGATLKIEILRNSTTQKTLTLKTVPQPEA